jgi:hypothetical protein
MRRCHGVCRADESDPKIEGEKCHPVLSKREYTKSFMSYKQPDVDSLFLFHFVLLIGNSNYEVPNYVLIFYEPIGILDITK